MGLHVGLSTSEAMKLRILSWNGRGENDLEKCKIQSVDVVCSQETKIHHMSPQLVRSLRVGRFLKWGVVEARETTRGLVVFWDNMVHELIGMEMGIFYISYQFKYCKDNFV